MVPIPGRTVLRRSDGPFVDRYSRLEYGFLKWSWCTGPPGAVRGARCTCSARRRRTRRRATVHARIDQVADESPRAVTPDEATTLSERSKLSGSWPESFRLMPRASASDQKTTRSMSPDESTIIELGPANAESCSDQTRWPFKSTRATNSSPLRALGSNRSGQYYDRCQRCKRHPRRRSSPNKKSAHAR